MDWADHVDAALDVCMDTFKTSLPNVYCPLMSMPGMTPFEIRGVFDAAYEIVDMSGEVPVSAVAPALGMRLADFPAGVSPKPEDRVRVTIKGVQRSYGVWVVQPDGQGAVRLILREKRP